MKHIQGSFLTGYIIISVKGNYPERFFQTCSSHGIAVWDIKKIANNHCIGNIKLKDLETAKNIVEGMALGPHLIVSLEDKKGLPFIFKKLLRKREFIVAFLISVLLVIFLSNILWKITITGVSKEMEEKINDQLSSYGIYQGAWSLSLESPNEIQQNLLNDIPELLWIGVHKQGTTIMLEGVEKTIVNKREQSGPRNLVAAKKGIIKKMYVEKGLPTVRVNEFVNAGDILVSGLITDGNEHKEKNIQKTYVAAEGTITANTWYEISVTVPLRESHELLTGNQEKRYYVRLANIEIPIWGFKNPDYKHIQKESIEEPIYFLKWELPIKIIKTILYEKVYNNSERSKERATELGLEQARNELLFQLDKNARILSEKVLHDATESGKVKLLIYVTVEEDIAKEEPITQGD